jgi:uncharacterized repeat protein (TIGR03837 family)
MLWDLFCRVVDNLGDLGVCLRLARDLASRDVDVRLWIDQPQPLEWMQPQPVPGVRVIHWHAGVAVHEPGDVVVEAFGCDPPQAFVERMKRPVPPVWINLEYLSAEDYVERSHRLPSPQLAGPGAGLVKWFFYPGFTERTGGLLREPGLMSQRARFDRHAWLATHDQTLAPGERCVSLFCYDNERLDAALQALAKAPTLLLVTPGSPARQVVTLLGPSLRRGALRAHLLPWLPQADYDRLLWSCDLNFVRGEDSFVRAQWAGAPFVWQIYPQSDGVHAAKLEAFLARHLAGAEEPVAQSVAALWRAWNGLSSPLPAIRAGQLAPWHAHVLRWRDTLLAQPDLTTALLQFVMEKR